MMLSSASSLLLHLFVAIPWRPVNSLGYLDTETCSAHPDPHMKSWHGIGYDYHHGCDVVFVKTNDIEIHLRLAKYQPVPTSYSLIERIGIRFGDGVTTNEVLEMDSNGDHFHNNDMMTPNPALATIGGYLFTKTTPGAQTQYLIALPPTGHYINIYTHPSDPSGSIYGLGITIRGHGTMFFDATGMCGQWNIGPNLNDRNGFDMASILPGGSWGGLNGADFGDAWQVDPSHPSFDPEIISDVILNPIANGLHAAHPNTCVARRRLEQQPDRELEVSLPCTFCDSMPNLGQRQNCIFDAGILGCNWVQSVPYYDTKDTVWYNEEDNKKDYYPCLQEADPDSVCSRVGKCTQWCDTKNFLCETCLGCNNDVDYNGEMLYNRYLKGCSCQIPIEVPVSTPSCPDGQAYLQIEVQGDEKSKGKNSYVLDVFYKAQKKWKKVTQKKKTLANEFHLYGNCHDVNKCYRFTIVDKKGNGICCESGYGYYKLNFDGQEIIELFEDGATQESSIGNCQGCVDPPKKKFKLPDGTALLCTQLLNGGFKKEICKKYPDSIQECCESCPPADNVFSFEGRKRITRASSVEDYDGMVANPPTNYYLRFTIEQTGLVTGFGSIIHFTTGIDCCNYSNRVPAVWFGGGNRSKLYVVTGHDADGNALVNSSEVALNTKTIVEILVVRTEMTLSLNGVVNSTMTIGDRSPLSDVKVFIGDPWYTAADAFISNVYFGPA